MACNDLVFKSFDLDASSQSTLICFKSSLLEHVKKADSLSSSSVCSAAFEARSVKSCWVTGFGSLNGGHKFLELLK